MLKFLAACAGAVLALASVAAQAAPACQPTAALTRIALPEQPFGVESSADGCWLFVTLGREGLEKGGLAVLHAAGGGFEVTQVVEAPDRSAGLALTHDGRTLAVAAGESVLLYDVAKLEAKAAGALIGRIPLGSGPVGAVEAAISPDDKVLFVTEERRARLAVIDLPAALARPGDGAAVRGTVALGRAPVGMALSPDGTRLYVTSEYAGEAARLPPNCNDPANPRHSGPHGLLQVIDTAAALKDPGHANLGVVIAGCQPVRVALSPDGKIAWVTARGDDDLLAVEVGQLSGIKGSGQMRRVRVGSAPVGVAVRPDGTQVWVADSDRFDRGAQGKLSVLRLGPSPVVQEIAAGGFPRELKFLPDGVTLAVTEFRGKSLALIATDRLAAP